MALPFISRTRGLVDAVASLFRSPPPFFVAPADGPVARRGSAVVAHDPRLRTIGDAVLERGGNAFDAFVAVTAAQNVMGEGASSLAGPLGALVYVGATGDTEYLDADFNDPLDRGWKWRARMPRDGRAVLVPGAPAGLEELAATHGTRSLSELLEPAVELAEEGFAVSRLLATFIKWRSGILKRSDYGRRTFFRADGKPLGTGDVLRQPEMAQFLEGLGGHGADYVYDGPWGEAFIEHVSSRHGVLTGRDLEHYRAAWRRPWTASYRGHRLQSCSGRSYGGVWALLALKTLEHRAVPAGRHYSSDAGLLEAMVHVARRVWAEPWVVDARALDDRRLVESRLLDGYTRGLWDDVAAEMVPGDLPAGKAHSYQVIVADDSGNLVCGTTTIESDPWGEGMFVEGVPLSTAGSIPWSTAPGERRLSPFSMHIAFRNARPRFAVGGISNSVVEAAFQFLVNLIDHELDVESAVTLPRFGTFPARRKLDMSKNWLDPRLDPEIVGQLEQRLKFERGGVIDTGSGAILAVARDGALEGMPVPLPYIADPFSHAG